jgi:hypothetical protein
MAMSLPKSQHREILEEVQPLTYEINFYGINVSLANLTFDKLVAIRNQNCSIGEPDLRSGKPFHFESGCQGVNSSWALFIRNLQNLVNSVPVYLNEVVG